MNLAILHGRVGQDPQIKYSPEGSPVCTYSFATNEAYKDKQGEKKQKTEWHRIVTFGKLAEFCGQHVKKGSELIINGTICTREWTDKDGIKRYTTEIQVPPFRGSVSFAGNGNGQHAAKQNSGTQTDDSYSPPFPSSDSDECPF